MTRGGFPIPGNQARLARLRWQLLRHRAHKEYLPRTGFLWTSEKTQAAQGDRLEGLYVLAIHTGLRQGELLALRWEDVDLGGGVLRVRGTKTARSRRTVKLSETALEALTSHLTRQLGEIDRVRSMWQENGLVFATEIGTPLSRHNLAHRSFRPLLARAGLPAIRFHDLRHTCATILLSQGVHAKFVQELLGHATIAITLDTYSHVLPGMSSGTADAMDEALR